MHVSRLQLAAGITRCPIPPGCKRASVLLQVRVGLVKRTKKLKAPVPELLVSQCPALKDKLGTDGTWKTAQTALTNYEQNGFVNEPNTLATAKSQVEGAVLDCAEHDLS